MKMAKPGMVEQELAGIMEGIAISGFLRPRSPLFLQNGEVMHGHSTTKFWKKDGCCS